MSDPFFLKPVEHLCMFVTANILKENNSSSVRNDFTLAETFPKSRSLTMYDVISLAHEHFFFGSGVHSMDEVVPLSTGNGARSFSCPRFRFLFGFVGVASVVDIRRQINRV